MKTPKFITFRLPPLIVVALFVIVFYSIYAQNSTKLEITNKGASIKIESQPNNNPSTNKNGNETTTQVVQTSHGDNSSNNYSPSKAEPKHSSLEIKQNSSGSNSPNTVN